MPINLGAVGSRTAVTRRRWTSADTLLYAVSVGAGADDPTGDDLRFTTEMALGQQRVLPTFAVIPGSSVPGFLELCGDFDRSRLVHAAQSVKLLGPLPVEGEVDVQATLVGVYDKGSAAVVESRTVATQVQPRRPLFVTGAKLFIRGEGGWGGDRGPSAGSFRLDRHPDYEVTYQTRLNQALLYRLNGDRNPLHCDPNVAASAGFERPILHGLCTFGFTGRALLHHLCEGEPGRLRSMAGQFSRPVFPGDELTVAIWRGHDGHAAFVTRCVQSGAVVVDAGTCEYQT